MSFLVKKIKQSGVYRRKESQEERRLDARDQIFFSDLYVCEYI